MSKKILNNLYNFFVCVTGLPAVIHLIHFYPFMLLIQFNNIKKSINIKQRSHRISQSITKLTCFCLVLPFQHEYDINMVVLA